MMCNENIVYICSVVATYWAVSISMVYLNKILMSNDTISIPAPLFITWYQCVITSIICWFAGLCGDRAHNQISYSRLNTVELGDPTVPAKPSFLTQFPKATYQMSTAVQIFPLSLIFVGMITFNNFCLKYVEVSFYNVARSLTIVFNVIFSWLLLGIPSNPKTMACLFIVVGGFAIGIQGETNFSYIGTACGLISSLFVSLNSIFTKKVLPIVGDNHWRLTWYNNVNASIIVAPLVYCFEADFVFAHFNQLKSPVFWSAMTTAGVFGFCIGIVTVLQIKATSPLSHNFSGTAKAGVQSMMAFYIWGNEPTVKGVFGIFAVLSGSLLYTYAKMNESNQTLHLMRSVSDVEIPKSSEN